MKEEELVVAHHVGDVINIIQETTHHLFDPDDLLTVSQLSDLHMFVLSLSPSLPSPSLPSRMHKHTQPPTNQKSKYDSNPTNTWVCTDV